MLDRDIEDTRQPKDDGVDTDELWAQVQDCLSKELYEFVQDEFEEAARELYHWLRQWRAVSKDLAALKERTRWHKWPDEKPEYGKWCLVRIGNTRHSVPAYLYEPDAVWRLWGSKISLEPHEVTKFLPIPEPPEDA